MNTASYQTFNNVDVTVDFNTGSYDVDCNTVNRNKDNVSQLVCEHGWSIGWGGGK